MDAGCDVPAGSVLQQPGGKEGVAGPPGSRGRLVRAEIMNTDDPNVYYVSAEVGWNTELVLNVLKLP